MGSAALIQYSNTIVDTSPDAAAVIAVVTVPGMATGAGINKVTLIGSVTLTTGADTTDVRAQWYRGTIAGAVTVGALVTLDIAAAKDGTVTVLATDAPPVGVHTYLIGLTQTAATVDATVTAVGAIALGTG